MSKTIIHCPCGAKVSLTHAEPGQKYRCPTCKKPIIATGSSEPAQHTSNQVDPAMPSGSLGGGMRNHGGIPAGGPAPAYGGAYAAPTSPPPPTNSMAVFGFVLSLVSFVFLLLAPIAFIVSVIGLRKPNGGLGVAGAVISALQSCVLICLTIMFFGLGFFTWTVAKEATETLNEYAEDFEIYTKTEMTRETLADAGEEIDTTAFATHELPTVDEGNELIRHHKDAWGNSLRYELDENALASYSIISPGPDGVAENSDDVGVSRPSCAPERISEALALLSGEGETQRLAGLDFVVSNSPEEAEANSVNRRAVLDSLVPLLSDAALGEDAAKAVQVWLDDDSVGRFSIRITSDPNIPASRTVDLLIDWEQQEEILEMLNHADAVVRSRVDRYVREEKIDEDTLIEQCFEDIQESEKAQQALTRLQTMKMDDAQKTQVVDRLADGLLRENIGLRHTEAAIEAITKLGADQDLIPRWIEIFDKTFDRNVRDALANSKDQRVVDHYANRLGRAGRISGEARFVLQDLGPVAEEAVLEKLKTAPTTGSLRSFLIDTLEHIGTEKSVPYLETLLDDEWIGDNAADAIREIEERAQAGQ